MTPGKYEEDPEWMRDLSPPQRAFFRIMTDQRIANLVEAADLIGDMDADLLQLLRAMSHENFHELRQFMWRAKPETLRFLYDLREQELEELEASIETYIAFKRAGRVIKWGAATLFAAFVGMSILWDKIVGIVKIPTK